MQGSIKYSTSHNSFHFGASYLSLPDRTAWKEYPMDTEKSLKNIRDEEPRCPLSYTDDKKAVWAFRGIET